ncbi:hypothetical protein BGX38DRAFT_1145836 [Terfezia claveryi]|nr:hypothetical protein BGX38DRAFT_1145836 [Terfezia claveryi]
MRPVHLDAPGYCIIIWTQLGPCAASQYPSDTIGDCCAIGRILGAYRQMIQLCLYYFLNVMYFHHVYHCINLTHTMPSGLSGVDDPTIVISKTYARCIDEIVYHMFIVVKVSDDCQYGYRARYLAVAVLAT